MRQRIEQLDAADTPAEATTDATDAGDGGERAGTGTAGGDG
ncbi:MAG TPA: hypothetical protein VGV10_02115 [Thermoleophilaceae bacterium]|nr:hypothetical protein [Thermoleophilaceae bacterium]